MTLAVLQASVLQTNGALSVAAGAQITVRTPANALATLYEDRAGTTPTGANPIFADSKGFFRVYVTPGRYDVTVTTGSGTQVYKDIALFADGSVIGTSAAADILGTVSATGTYPNLVPTGAIMEAGSNANGQYVKYADGTMIARFTSSTIVTSSSAVGNIFESSSFSFSLPAAFVLPPEVFFSVFRTNGKCWASGGAHASRSNTSTSLLHIMGSSSTDAGYPSYVAIGRWK